MSNPAYPWKRYLCLRSNSYSVDLDGFITDPEQSKYGKDLQPNLKTVEETESHRCVVYLGEPGIGKSSVVRQAVEIQKEKKDPNAVIVHKNLNLYSSDAFLVQDIFQSHEIKNWKENGKTLFLFLDSLDECLLRVDTVAQILLNQLSQLPTNRLCVRISCRTGAWLQFLEQELVTIFSKKDLIIYEVVPLLERDIESACKVETVDSEKFLKEVRDRGVVPLAIKPVTLKFLMNSYKSSQKLPNNQSGIYLDGCRQLCDEPNESRQTPKRSTAINGGQKFKIAGQVAVLSILSNKSSIWLGKEHEKGESDLSIRDLTEYNIDGLPPISETDLRQTLDSGLFTSRGPNKLGWAHQTYAEFLMALHLTEAKVDPAQLRSLFFNPNPENPKLVPQLQQGAAFLSSMNLTFLDVVLDKDPEVLLKGDLSNLTDEYKERALQRIFDEVEHSGNHTYFDWGMRERFTGLKHSRIEEQLRSIIKDKDRSVSLRRLVVDIAEVCELTGLVPDILSQALDKSEDYYIRNNAACAINSIGDQKSKAQLKALLMDEEDPYDELKGYTLKALWPNSISATELFEYLTTPKRDNFSGAYAAFLYYDLIGAIGDKDVPTALAWAEQHALSHQNYSKIGQAVEKVIYHGWKRLDEADAYRPFARLAYKKLSDHHHIIERFESKEFAQDFSQAIDKRRKIFLAIFEQIPVEEIDAFFVLRLLDHRDFFWLTNIANAERDQTKFRKLIEVLRYIFDWGNSSHVDAVFKLVPRDPFVAQEFKWVLGPIELGSDDAKKMRERYESEKEWQEREKKEKVDWPSKINTYVVKDIQKIEAGEPIIFWHLARLLTADVKTGRYSEEHEIAEAPIWIALDKPTQDKIIEFAKSFLEVYKPDIGPYLENNSFNWGISAGLKAIHLLEKYDASYLTSQGPQFWQKWLPAVLAYPTFGSVDQEAQMSLLSKAYVHAESEFNKTVLQLAEKEGRSNLNHVFVVSKFSSFIGKSLQAELFNLARSLPPKPAISILAELVELGLTDAEKSLVGYISIPLPKESDQREVVFSAIKSLVENTPNAGWDIIWPLITSNKDSGREIMLNGISTLSRESEFLTKLTDRQIADLYSWMVVEFPYIDRGPGARWVGPEERAGHIRDAALRMLVHRGSRESCKALEDLVRKHPNLPWLKSHLLDAQKRNRWLEWSPPGPVQLLNLMVDRTKMLVRNEEELLQVILSSIRKFEQALHGTTPAITDVWNTEDGQYHPKDENEISDRLKRHFEQDIKAKGIIANREVEIRRSVGKGTGQRTDIQIDAVVQRADGFDQITVIVEVKGCWHNEVLLAAQTQLANRYLKDNSTRHGIYVVADFLCPKWTDDDNRKAQSNRNKVRENFPEIQKLAKTQNEFGYSIEAALIDCRYRT